MQENSSKKGEVVENIQRSTSNKQTPKRSIQIVKFLCQNTANTTSQRSPPSETKTDHVRLVTIGVRISDAIETITYFFLLFVIIIIRILIIIICFYLYIFIVWFYSFSFSFFISVAISLL